MLNKNQRRISKLPHELYKAYDANGTLLYVGVSVDVLTRLKGHRGYARWYRQIDIVKVWVYPTRYAALDEEARCIAEDHPKFNVTQESRKAPQYRAAPTDSYALVNEPYSGWCYRELHDASPIARP